MDTNNFLVKIKANGNSKDWDDLSKAYDEYKKLLSKLTTKDRGVFSLNVVCLLCRNLEKVPSWTNAIDTKDLLTLTIDCVRETRGLNKAEQVKTLACIYHIHKHVVKQHTQVPPELILKISYMAFESDTKNILKEYCKTYWNILAERLTYLEKLKGKSIHKLLPKVTEDLLKIIEIYDAIPLCSTVLVFLFKKLRVIFGDCSSEQLNVLYGEIFKKISSKTDLDTLKKLPETEALDLYFKISDCLYVVAENASKNNFKACSLSLGVRTAISLLGHRSDMFHCLQTFYLNSFCDLFENKTPYADAMFKNLTVSCDITEKLGYKKTMVTTYAFLNQFLRLYIEHSVTNSIKANFSKEIQGSCLELMLKIIGMLKYSPQLLKCENCKVNSGLHDGLRLSFLLKSIITISLEHNINITPLTVLYNKIFELQYSVISELKSLNCYNYKKFYLRLQTDTHNIAILLNRHKIYDFSINLFNIYIKNESESINLARAFYNKSICELDSKKYEIALLDAFLGLTLSKDLKSEKYMSLVMDIKAKSMNDEDNSDERNYLQQISVIEAIKLVMERELYGDMKIYMKDAEFSGLLKHEFAMYAKLWPSIIPVSAVWKSLLNLLEGTRDTWMKVEDKDTILWTLLDVISTTPSVVRTINNDTFKDVVFQLLEKINKIPDPVAVDIRVAQTTLLFLKAEYDIADASSKYGWKVTETITDPDQIQLTRTIEQENTALQSALQAVELWVEVAAEIHTVTTSCLPSSLQLADIFVQHLLYFDRLAHGLQLAHVCCRVANSVGLQEIFVRNAGVLAYHIQTPGVLQDTISSACEYCCQLMNKDSIETVIIFLSDLAIYNYKYGSKSLAVQLTQIAQMRILKAYEEFPDINLDLAVGKLMEAEILMCSAGPSVMSAVNGLQRHYVSVVNNAPSWSRRRVRSASTKYCLSVHSSTCIRTCRALALWRRARAAGALGLRAGAAGGVARGVAATVCTQLMQEAQVTIDNRLKYILGLSTEHPNLINEPKMELFAPKQDLEVMLESQPLKSLSPTRKYVQIPGYQTPEFLKHVKCDCFACDNPVCSVIACTIGGLEASMYFRADETEIARNYYKGVIVNFGLFEPKLKYILDKYKDMGFEEYIINCVKKCFEDEFRLVKLEILIEATYFELKNKNFERADDNLVCVHELFQDLGTTNRYINNEVLNLLIASAKVRNVDKKKDFSLENEFENLKLSPKGDVPKTPISKFKLPEVSSKKITVKDEEIPKKRKVIKLNLDEGSSDEKDQEKPKTRKPVFKIPVPVTSKPVLETMTPRVYKKPEITVTEATNTPKTDKFTEFFTPQSTPEQFFTPLTNIRTYSKSNLRKNIVKNLEEEFSTPVGKESKQEKVLEVPTRSGRKTDNNRALRRATSPGKLSDSKTRPRRLRQPRLNDE